MTTMTKTTTLLAFGITAILSLGSAASAVTIDTTPFWDGTTSIGSFGGAGTGVYGETFTAPGGALTSYTFFVSTDVDLSVVGQVYAWSGALLGGSGPQGATGPALFTGTPFTISAGDGFQAITVNTGAVSLASGSNFVILLASLGGDQGNAAWGLTGFFSHPGVAGDGGFNFYNNDRTLASINTNDWDSFDDFGSLAYTATFAPVPEAASWAMLIAGFGLVGAAARRRRVAVAA